MKKDIFAGERFDSSGATNDLGWDSVRDAGDSREYAPRTRRTTVQEEPVYMDEEVDFGESAGGSFSGLDSQDTLRERMITGVGKNARPCFGGYLFRSKNTHRFDTVVHAVKGISKSRAQQLVNNRYFPMGMCRELFLAWDHSSNENGYVFFAFRLPYGYKSLREQMEEPDFRPNPKVGATLFSKLVDFLCRYQQLKPWQTNATSREYSPLAALSLDTVFLHKDTHDIQVLPLYAINGSFPVCYPGEAGKSGADISTDLYTAALVALQFMSGCEYEADGGRMASCDAIPGMRECLSVFSSWRPPLEEVAERLRAFRSDSSTGGAYTRSGDSIETENDVPVRPNKGSNGFWNGLFGRKDSRGTVPRASGISWGADEPEDEDDDQDYGVY